MSDYNYDEHLELSDGGNTTVIPTKNVIAKIFDKGSIILVKKLTGVESRD